MLIDEFVVPEESMPEFMEAVRRIEGLLSSLPGFVEGYIYEKKDGQNEHNVLTTAVWKDADAMKAAFNAAQAQYQKWGFNPRDIMKRLKVEGERTTYTRRPYSIA